MEKNSSRIVRDITMFLRLLYLNYSPSTKNRLVISVQGGKFNGPTAHIFEIKLHFSSHTYPPYSSGGSDPFASVRLSRPQHVAFQTATIIEDDRASKLPGYRWADLD
ncbi:hypothetical protein PENSUB_10171 [Penicillium subrubescens]|uniref:Uncharacterized protein n=1 Tax=Penicillium subrubescens TaxID=1316194 RepID=A0A1Q5TAZ9_9EURO|nr:hypothetical protein PENSUB_10171 [Penicillium subrubescens]